MERSANDKDLLRVLADTVRRRLMMQSGSKERLYNGTLDCFAKILKNEVSYPPPLPSLAYLVFLSMHLLACLCCISTLQPCPDPRPPSPSRLAVPPASPSVSVHVLAPVHQAILNSRVRG